MCTPQFQQAIAGAQAAGIIPGQQRESIEEGMASSGTQSFDPRQNDPRYAGAMASQISELFDPRTGQRIRQLGPATEMPMVPISKEEFDGPQVQHVQHMMSKEYAPMPPMQTIPMIRKEMIPLRRSPTVGELLGIPPGTTQEVGGPGRF